MTGLENIISQIRLESDSKISEIQSKATETAREIISDAEQKKEEMLAEYLKIAEQKKSAIIERTNSLKKIKLNNAILVKKQDIIKDITEKAKDEIKGFGEEEYFAFLSRLLQKFCLSGKGKILLAKDDIKRMPKNFKTELKKWELEVELTSQKMGSGFVLVYGNIEVNCTIDELFESAKSEICDLVNELLFVR